MRITGRQALQIVPIVVAALATAACQSLPARTNAAATSNHIQQILASGELRVGMTGAQPPLNMKTRDGRTVGLEVDMVDALAEAMGVRPRIIEMSFSDLLPSLEKGELDLVISGVTITPERNARVAFAGPYFISGAALLVRQDSLTGPEDSGERDDPSRTYTALAGTTSEAYVKARFPNAKLVSAASYDEATQLLLDGRADALAADYLVCAVTALRHPEASFAVPITPLTTEPLGIALPADDPLFVNLVENYLATLEYTGVLAELKARWVSAGTWLSDLP